MLSTRHGVRVLGIADLADFLGWPPATRWSTSSPTTAPAPPTWSRAGWAARCGAGSPTASCRRLPRGRQPGPGAGDRGRRPRVRGARPDPGPHGLHGRRTADGGAHLLGRRRRDVGPPARAALGPAAHGDRRPAGRRARPGRTPHHPRRPGRGLSRVRRDVHRGGRHLARSTAGERSSTAPGSASWSPAAGRSPGSRRPAGVQGRGRVRLAVRRAGPGRLGPARPPWRGHRRPRAWPPSSSWSAPTSRRSVSLYVNEYNRPARAAYERVGFRQTDTFATIMF